MREVQGNLRRVEQGPYRKEGTPCERCWPGIDDKNIEAWEVYKMSAADTSPSNIQSICSMMEANDPQECLLKINHIISKITEKEKELGKSEENKDNVGNR